MGDLGLIYKLLLNRNAAQMNLFNDEGQTHHYDQQLDGDEKCHDISRKIATVRDYLLDCDEIKTVSPYLLSVYVCIV